MPQCPIAGDATVLCLLLLRTKCICIFCNTLLYRKILYCIVSSYCNLFFVLYFSVFSAYVANRPKRFHYYCLRVCILLGITIDKALSLKCSRALPRYVYVFVSAKRRRFAAALRQAIYV